MVHITWIQALFCGILYWLAIGNLPFVGLWTLQKPLVCGTLTGLILGHPVEGAVIGASINLMYIGFVSAGGSMPADISLAGIVGTAYAIHSGVDTKTALALAVPIGLLGVFVWAARMTVDSVFVHRADRYIEREEYHKIWRANVLYPQIFCATIAVLPCSISIYYGSKYISSLLALLDGGVLSSLQILGSLMPCLGIAITMTYIFEGEYKEFFFLGFLVTAYCELPLHMIGVFALVIGVIYMQMKGRASEDTSAAYDDAYDQDLYNDEVTEEISGENPYDLYNENPEELYAESSFENEVNTAYGEKGVKEETRHDDEKKEKVRVQHLLPRKALLRAWLIWETFPQTCYNYERMMGQHMAHMFVPLLQYLYKNDPQKQKELMQRESIFYNTHVEVGACVSGMAVALEEQKAINDTVPDSLIRNLKTSFMGPLAGMGDTLWQGIFIPVMLVFCIDITNMNGGNIWGAVIYSGIVIFTALIFSYYNFMLGYRFGGESIVHLLENHKLKSLISVATIIGCMVMGALVVKYVNCACGLTLTYGDSVINLQEELFDKICPYIISLLMTLLVFYLMKRRGWSANRVILLCVAISVVGGFTGILTTV